MRRQPGADLEFREACRSRGLAATHQRLVIYDALTRLGPKHPSTEDVYEQVRRQIPSISLGTVYKNIKTFVEAGLIAEVSPHYGSLRLDPNMEPHHHAVCIGCKAIIDVEGDAVEPVQLRRPLPRGFQVKRFTVEAVGLCEACAASNSNNYSQETTEEC